MKKKDGKAADGSTVRSVDRAIDLLEVLLSQPRSISLAELSEKVNLSPSTAHRLLSTLEKRRLVYQDPFTKVYSPGLLFMYPAPGLRQHQVLRNMVVPFLQEISQNTGEGASLAIISGNHAMVVAKSTSGRSVDTSLQSGVLVPLHCTAVGKAILAYLKPDEVKRIIDQEGLPAKTPNTITDFGRLKEDLETVKEQGYAIDNEEGERGICCVAVPVFSYGKNIFGAISVSGPTGRIVPSRHAQIAEITSAIAIKLSAKLGCIEENSMEVG